MRTTTRGWGPCLAVLGVALTLALRAAAQAPAPADPLPSWNDGPAKQSLVKLVRAVTDAGSPQHVPPAARNAVFDNDGTLWSEQPMYSQGLVAFDRVKALAPKHPEWSARRALRGAGGDPRAHDDRRVRADGEAIVGAGAPARAGEADPDGWQVTVIPYVWAAGLYGDVTVRGVTASPDASFLDVLESSDSLVGLQGHVAVTRGRFTGFADALYLKLRVNDAGVTELDVTTRMWFVEFGLEYRLLDTTGGEGRGVALDAYAGGRYSYLDLDLDTRGAPSFDQSKDWIDPIVGSQVTVDVTPRFFILVRGDVGGFGAASDFAWSATGLLGYRWRGLGLDWAVLAGYKALAQDYETGSGGQRFRWDTTMHGPIVGLRVRF